MSVERMRVPEGPTKSALSVFLSAHSLSVPNGVRPQRREGKLRPPIQVPGPLEGHLPPRLREVLWRSHLALAIGASFEALWGMRWG